MTVFGLEPSLTITTSLPSHSYSSSVTNVKPQGESSPLDRHVGLFLMHTTVSGPPVEVGVTMYVLSISSVSEVLMVHTHYYLLNTDVTWTLTIKCWFLLVVVKMCVSHPPSSRFSLTICCLLATKSLLPAPVTSPFDDLQWNDCQSKVTHCSIIDMLRWLHDQFCYKIS